MEVQLLVYDLSRGLSRQMSMGFLGFQLDAIYHTSIELNGREYVYDGGILAIQPYSSHLGHPMEKLPLGSTSLTMDVIEEYLDSIRPIFTAEAYDLFQHNCNNFTDSFAKFLLGHGIPEYITGMPRAVMASPMGRMLLPQLVQSVNAGRRQNSNGSLLGLQNGAQQAQAPALPPQSAQLKTSAFPSASHPHSSLRLPSFSNAANTKPVLFEKKPPLDKLIGKLGEEMAGRPVVHSLRRFLEERDSSSSGTRTKQNGPASVAIPDLAYLGQFVREAVQVMPRDTLFAAVDLFRCSLVDPRVSGFFAEEPDHATVQSVLSVVSTPGSNGETCPYALRLVALQMVCNLFSSPLYERELFSHAVLRPAVVQLVSASFLDDNHNSVRAASASLLFNMALAIRRSREGTQPATPPLPDEDQVELAASVVEAIGQETASGGALQVMLMALGHMIYGAPLDGELIDLLRVLDAAGVVQGKAKAFPDEPLIAEVGSELLGKALEAGGEK
ncbi:hypothetical protein SEPCBS119000_001815 [Sporothrix epigloea]|uniref:Uncharacterized protein n=1 Tax=Sporothrix epigloea TaxID=1892477 RepID=A0ABP0DEH2_9PEZI